MLPQRPIGREAPPPPPPRPPVDDGRVSEIATRLARLEGDRQWLRTLLVIVVVSGVLGPLGFLWISDQRADRHRAEIASLDARVQALDRDLTELLSAVLEEDSSDGRLAAVAPEEPRGPTVPAPARVARETPLERPEEPPEAPRPQRPPEKPPDAPRPQRPQQRPDWAETLGGRILNGPLDARERADMRSQWDNLEPAVQQQTLNALLRRYGLDPESFHAALEDPAPLANAAAADPLTFPR